MILKYKIDQDRLQDWIDHDYDFSYFVGDIYRYNVNDIISNFSSNNTNSKNLPANTCPCNIEPIDGTTGNGGGGGSGGTGGGSGGGASSGTFTVCHNQVVTVDNPCDGAGDPDSVWTNEHNPTYVSGFGHCSGSPGPTNILVTVCETVSSKFATAYHKTQDDDCLNPCDDDPDNTNGDIGIILPSTSLPCTKMNALANDDTFKGYLGALKTFANNTTPAANREIAYTRDDSGNYSDVFIGDIGGDNINVAVTNNINIHMHTHQPQALYPNSLPVFSSADLYTIYSL